MLDALRFSVSSVTRFPQYPENSVATHERAAIPFCPSLLDFVTINQRNLRAMGDLVNLRFVNKVPALSDCSTGDNVKLGLLGLSIGHRVSVPTKS